MLAQVGSWSPARQAFRESPASWSAIGVLDHLVKVDRGVLANIRHHLPNGRSVKLKHEIYRVLVFGTLVLPTRVGQPAGAGPIEPDADADLGMVTDQWKEVRAEMSQLLESLRPEQFRCGLFRHPISGYMNISRTMQFLFAHMFHHRYQLSRIRRASRSLAQISRA
jgi:hypothetical protein